MKLSNKIQKLSLNPSFKKSEFENLNYNFEMKLNKLDIELEVEFDTFKKDELVVSKAFYKTNYAGEYLGVIDAFFYLIQGKPCEAIDRFPIKELDYFLRDIQSESAFEGYSQKLYEIIAIGERVKEAIYGKKGNSFSYSDEQLQNFPGLSASEQFDIIEEFLSFHFYKNGVTLDQIECTDIEENKIYLKSSDEHKTEIKRRINDEFNGRVEVNFV